MYLYMYIHAYAYTYTHVFVCIYIILYYINFQALQQKILAECGAIVVLVTWEAE